MIYDINGNSIYSAENNGALNVLDYGFSPDGVTDNLEAFNVLLQGHPAQTLYFPNGVYAFSGKLILDQCYIELDNAELKCMADTKVDRFLEIRGKMYPPETPQQDMFIRGNGKINANFKADDAIALARQKHTTIDGISIQNFQRYGICGKFEETALGNNLSYETVVHNCLIETSLECADAVGIYDTGDSTFTDVVILNAKTALSCSGSSIFHNIHAWCFDFEYKETSERIKLFKDTVFAEIRANGTRFSDCYCDTYQRGFRFASGQYYVYVSGFKWFISPDTWPEGLEAYVFPVNPTGDAMYKVFGANINGQGVTKFSDGDMSNKENCRWYGVVHNLSDAPDTLS